MTECNCTECVQRRDDARDAARYRHLRRNATSRFGRQPNDEEFDAMIDEAIAKESK